MRPRASHCLSESPSLWGSHPAVPCGPREMPHAIASTGPAAGLQRPLSSPSPNLFCTQAGLGWLGWTGSGSHPAGRSPTPFVGEHAEACGPLRMCLPGEPRVCGGARLHRPADVCWVKACMRVDVPRRPPCSRDSRDTHARAELQVLVSVVSPRRCRRPSARCYYGNKEAIPGLPPENLRC